MSTAMRVLILAMSLVLGSAGVWLLQGAGLRIGVPPPLAVAGTITPDQSPDSAGATSDQSAGTPAAATPVAAAAAPVASGTILASDPLTSATGGLFKSGSNASFTWGYSGGHYEISSNGPVVLADRRQNATGDFADVTVTVDAQQGPKGDPSTMGGVGCRVGSNGQGGYELRYVFANSNWLLYRLDPGPNGVAQLGGGNLNVPPVTAVPHHLKITCQGTAITASVDGVQAISLQDSGYAHGQGSIMARAAGNSTNAVANGQGYPTNVDVIFSNLVETQP